MAEDKDYEVGYGKPPKATRFQNGQSGNPKGRPKGIQNTATLARKLMAEQISVTENGRSRRMTMHEVLLRQLLRRAAKGDVRSTMTMLELAERGDGIPESEVEAPDTPEKDEVLVHQTLLRMREELLREGELSA